MKSIKGTSVVCALVLAGAISAAFAASPACARIRVVASITDLGSIASEIGGDQVEVVTIARPTDDVHHVEVLPSYMVRVSRAQLYLKVGLGLDRWADQIIDGSRNDHPAGGGLRREDRSAGEADRKGGRVHGRRSPQWKPALLARSSQRGGRGGRDRAGPGPSRPGPRLRLSGPGRRVLQGGGRGDRAGGASDIDPPGPRPDHLSLFMGLSGSRPRARNRRDGRAGPGIPPTAQHLQDLVQLIKERRIRVFLQEPYFSDDAGRFLAREAGVTVIKASPSCDDVSAGCYLAHFKQLATQIAAVSANSGS